MAIKHHTVIFVPHSRAKLRKWRLKNTQIAAVLTALALLTITAGFIVWSYFATEIDRGEIEQLRVENEKLREVNQSFETSILKLEGRLADYEERTRQLAIVAGIEGVTADSEGGVGGATGSTLGPSRGLSALEGRSFHLENLLEQVQGRLNERVQWISSTPSIAPVRGIVTSGFGYRRDPFSGLRAFHQGIDISAAPGREVRAPGDGIVLRSARVGGLGRAVYVSHGFGLSTRYGHLSRTVVEPGQTIERGDLIGYVGSSGRSTSYHLHYEVRVDGKAANPLAYILDRSSGRRL
jgi:murein DD-endopeptidase MepM/ murein hydrolase activator NlpD